MRHALPICVIVLSLKLGGFVLAIDPPCANQKLIASDGGENDYFGSHLAVSENSLLVSAPYADAAGGDAGAVYAFKNVGGVWIEDQIIHLEEDDPYAIFGRALARSGDTALIAASWGGWKGAVYVFVFNGTSWEQVQKLTADDADALDFFGVSISIDGNVAIIGADGNDDLGSHSGSAYVFRFNGTSWVQEQKLLPLDGVAEDYFGATVAISGNTAMVEARRVDTEIEDAGAVYVFEFDGLNWTQTQKITLPDGQPFEYFGLRMLMIADTAYLSAPYHGENGSYLVYQRSGPSWVHIHNLPSYGSLAVHGDTAIVGDGGRATIYRFNGLAWVEEQYFEGVGYFGTAVDLLDDHAIVGAQGERGHAPSSGAVHDLCLRSGVCCDVFEGVCTSDVFQSQCAGEYKSWTGIDSCSEVVCSAIHGACCTVVGNQNGDCIEADLADCPVSPSVSFTRDAACADVRCITACDPMRLSNSDSSFGDWFGYNVAISGNVSVVGSWSDDESDSGSGSATVFRFDGFQWTEEQEFLHPNPYGSNLFGSVIAIDNDTISVGAPGTGEVYIYRFDGHAWFLEQALSAPSGIRRFGTDVSISGDAVLVGALGKAFVFRRQSSVWTMEQQFVQPDANFSSFGNHVSIHGNVAAIADLDSDYRGVYLYRFDGSSWLLEQKIDGYTYSGRAISLSDDSLAVGGGFGVFVFRFNGSAWSEEAVLTGAGALSFGLPLSLSGDSLLTGGTLPEFPDSEYPVVFIFRRSGSTWFQESVLSTPSGDYGDFFGWSVSLDDGVALVGAKGVDVSQYQDDSGAAYVFMLDKSGACCDRETGTCTSCQLETECTGQDFLWTRSRDCSETSCSLALGACCDHQVDGNPTISHCTQTSFADCNCPACQWTIDADCSAIACEPTHAAIPALTEWGMVALTLSLLIVSKIAFSRQNA